MNDLPIIQSDPPAGTIDLGLGNPDPTLLPVELIQLAAADYFATGDRRPLQYGLEQGDGYFRQVLSDFLAAAYQQPVHSSQLFISSGASSALDLLCTLYTSPGDTILVEKPTYYLALRIFQDHRLNIVCVGGDQDGLDLERLEWCLATYHPKLIYLVPTFQNPSGRTLSQNQREKLIELALRQDTLLVADEVYHFLAYSELPPPPFGSYARQFEQVVSVGSFSKILAPGLRLGWLQAHQKVIQRLAGSGLLDSGGGLNPFTSAIIYRLFGSGRLETHISYLQQVYSARLEAMAASLLKFIPQSSWIRPAGGFYFWVRLPGVDAAELRQKAAKFELGLRQGALFSCDQGLSDYLRLSFSYYPVRDIEEGLRRLRTCLDASFDTR